LYARTAASTDPDRNNRRARASASHGSSSGKPDRATQSCPAVLPCCSSRATDAQSSASAWARIASRGHPAFSSNCALRE
jgi:hypothetical protein